VWYTKGFLDAYSQRTSKQQGFKTLVGIVYKKRMMNFNLIFPFIKELVVFSPENIFMLAVGFFWLLISSIQDFKHREVENWWNFSLIVFILAFRAFLSIEKMDYFYILWGLIGLAGGFFIANLFYYSRLFAGGDAKLLMALGTILPLSFSWKINLEILAVFLLLLMIAGAIYGIIFSLFLVFLNLKGFRKEFHNQLQKNKTSIFYSEFVLIILGIIFFAFKFYLGIYLLIILIISPFLLIYAKSVEEGCMNKKVRISDLTIGDWTVGSIKAGKKLIKPNWEGLSEDELKLIKKHCKGTVLVKQGIPFVPVFLIAFLLLIVVLAG
jgi:Flp pilus assembly protein protease CpaA